MANKYPAILNQRPLGVDIRRFNMRRLPQPGDTVYYVKKTGMSYQLWEGKIVGEAENDWTFVINWTKLVFPLNFAVVVEPETVDKPESVVHYRKLWLAERITT